MKAFACVLLALTVSAVLAHPEGHHGPQPFEHDVNANHVHVFRHDQDAHDTCELEPGMHAHESLEAMEVVVSEDKLYAAKMAGFLMFRFDKTGEIKHLDMHVREISEDPAAQNVALIRTDCAEMRIVSTETDRNSAVSHINIQYKFVNDGQTVEGVCNVHHARMQWPVDTHYACPRTMIYSCEGDAADYRVKLVLDSFEFEARKQADDDVDFTTKQARC